MTMTTNFSNYIGSFTFMSLLLFLPLTLCHREDVIRSHFNICNVLCFFPFFDRTHCCSLVDFLCLPSPQKKEREWSWWRDFYCHIFTSYCCSCFLSAFVEVNTLIRHRKMSMNCHCLFEVWAFSWMSFSPAASQLIGSVNGPCKHAAGQINPMITYGISHSQKNTYNHTNKPTRTNVEYKLENLFI